MRRIVVIVSAAMEDGKGLSGAGAPLWRATQSPGPALDLTGRQGALYSFEDADVAQAVPVRLRRPVLEDAVGEIPAPGRFL